MRASRTCAAVAAALVAAAAAAGCGSGGSGGSGDGSASPPPASATASRSASGSPSASASPPARTPPASPSASPSTTVAPPASETLLRVSRTGGYAGRPHTLRIAPDGSWTRLGADDRPEGSGTLDPAGLEALRAALRAADLPRLPRTARADPPVRDGFTYSFAHGGVEVSADQDVLAPGLAKVLAALPGFDPEP
ncbi:hypothetical protein ACGFXC_25455 [Streptomyces sp. NPDC048507]|uniref:hypothetical protein n=1 Tax=Streptomyces sp. NPDC048507 TaxID=3365560 RepID=UPI0037101F26